MKKKIHSIDHQGVFTFWAGNMLGLQHVFNLKQKGGQNNHRIHDFYINNYKILWCKVWGQMGRGQRLRSLNYRCGWIELFDSKWVGIYCRPCHWLHSVEFKEAVTNEAPKSYNSDIVPILIPFSPYPRLTTTPTQPKYDRPGYRMHAGPKISRGPKSCLFVVVKFYPFTIKTLTSSINSTAETISW